MFASLTVGGCVGSSVRLITLDPGHFHAALVQKSTYSNVDPVVHVYAPAGDDLQEHLKRIEGFNTRADQPTHWQEQVYSGLDYFQKMLNDRAGNVVVIAGNNSRKTDYILRSVEAGLNVLGDKPMAITPTDFEKLKQAFTVAESRGVLLYDIMTERFEITSILQRELAWQSDLFGNFVTGSADQPAIIEQSVHCFSKVVSGRPLKRPAWFFDVRQQGESMVDVATHLVDLIQCAAFPEQALSPTDVQVISARRWATTLTPAQFQKVTGEAQFPSYLSQDVQNGVLNVYANGEMNYRLRGIHAKVTATWDFEAPPGAGDSHYSLMRGTRANLVIRQREAEKFKPVLCIEKSDQSTDDSTFETRVRAAIAAIEPKYPGIGLRRESAGWAVTIPAKYDVGHEAHFGQVANRFLQYLREGRLPDWEVPNMLTKYATVMKAYELSR